MEVYNKYSNYLKQRYGDKVYKIPVNIEGTCPNRDGTCGRGGCSFCGEIGAGFEMRDAKESVQEQLLKNISFIKEKYKAKYFIAYLQNYSNTYMPPPTFKKIITDVAKEDIIGIAVSTRPDCIHDEYLELLKEWKELYQKDVCIELGLQTVNYHTLNKINRGHTLAEYLDAVMHIKKYDFEICTHLILNLPWDTMEDVIENAKIMSVLNIDYVKLHALYILKGTEMGRAYENGEFEMISLLEYQERVIHFLRHLKKEIVVQRIIGRAPKEYTLFANWNTSWWKIHDWIQNEMQEKGYYQGELCDYTHGKAVKKFL